MAAENASRNNYILQYKSYCVIISLVFLLYFWLNVALVSIIDLNKVKVKLKSKIK